MKKADEIPQSTESMYILLSYSIALLLHKWMNYVISLLIICSRIAVVLSTLLDLKIQMCMCTWTALIFLGFPPDSFVPFFFQAAHDEEDEEEEDDDFVEVPMKEGYEEHIPEHLREEYGLVKKPQRAPTSR